jgi:catalase
VVVGKVLQFKWFFVSYNIYNKQKIMKHILNNLSEEEKNAIREQHTGGMKVMTENFNKLINSKLGDSKPLVNEQKDEEDVDN